MFLTPVRYSLIELFQSYTWVLESVSSPNCALNLVRSTASFTLSLVRVFALEKKNSPAYIWANNVVTPDELTTMGFWACDDDDDDDGDDRYGLRNVGSVRTSDAADSPRRLHQI